jgi:hypothetical protein
MEPLKRFTLTPAWLAALFSAAVVVLALPLAGTASGCRGVEHDPEAILDAFEKMHSNIYQVYRLTDPGEVFDLLSRSLEGEELEKQVYEYLKCLKVQAEFNTRISIAEVFYNDLQVVRLEEDLATVYCKWVVIGKVRHPTHIHRKTNLNEALYRVHMGGSGPRIVGYDLITNQEVEVTNR